MPEDRHLLSMIDTHFPFPDDDDYPEIDDL